MKVTNRRSREDQSFHLSLRSEAIAVEAAVSVFQACRLLLGVEPWRAFGGALVAGSVSAALIQTLRLAPDRPDDTEVEINLFGEGGTSALPNGDSQGTDRDDEPATMFGRVLVIVACLMADQASLWKAAVVWALSLGVAAPNEYLVVQPLARRKGVSLE